MSQIAKAHIRGGRPTRLKAGISRVEDLANGQEALGLMAIGAKTVYYCDGNAGVDGNSGIGGWENAKQTLAAALAVSQTDISANSLGWAARNIIYCRGDTFTEDLVLLAQKTDVIGVGSYDANARPGLVGNHVPTGAANSGLGTRFFNFYFRTPAAGGDMWTLDSTVANLGFHSCKFNANSSTPTGGAIVNTASAFMGLYNNEFVGKFSDAVIEFGAGDGFRGTRIVGNYIEGDDAGIELAAGTTDSAGASEEYGYISDNLITTVGITIDDDANIARVLRNILISEAATIAAAVDINLPMAAANYLTNPTVNMIYPTEDAST